jgi:hypothetical protein
MTLDTREKLESISDEQIRKCKFCHRRIGWLESKKNPGKKYPVNLMDEDFNGEYIVNRYDFHNCRQ